MKKARILCIWVLLILGWGVNGVMGQVQLNYWDLHGNFTTNSGEFLGTRVNEPLIFKVDDTHSGILHTTGKTFIGFQGGEFAIDDNTGFGNGVLQHSQGKGNTGMGNSALRLNVTGYWNTAIGDSALYSNSAGYGNTALGYISLPSNTTGWGNTGLGAGTLYGNTTGNWNTGVGQVLFNNTTTGSENCALGYFSLGNNTTGYSNAQLVFTPYLETAPGTATLLMDTTPLRTTPRVQRIPGLASGVCTTTPPAVQTLLLECTP
ncbi:MAG: hypothetical protein U0176_09880 [Bacteroidia bacterium]